MSTVVDATDTVVTGRHMLRTQCRISMLQGPTVGRIILVAEGGDIGEIRGKWRHALTEQTNESQTPRDREDMAIR